MCADAGLGGLAWQDLVAALEAAVEIADGPRTGAEARAGAMTRIVDCMLRLKTLQNRPTTPAGVRVEIESALRKLTAS